MAVLVVLLDYDGDGDDDDTVGNEYSQLWKKMMKKMNYDYLELVVERGRWQLQLRNSWKAETDSFVVALVVVAGYAAVAGA